MIKEFFLYNKRQNWGLWAHVFCASLIAGIVNLLFGRNWDAVVFIFFLMIGWEIIEYIWENGADFEKAKKNYGSAKNFFFDLIGDIFISLIPVIAILGVF